MTSTEMAGIAKRDVREVIPLWLRLVIYCGGIVAPIAIFIWKALPVVAAVAAAPAAVDTLTVRLDSFEERMEAMVRTADRRYHADSLQRERMVCMQEVAAGIRPGPAEQRCSR